MYVAGSPAITRPGHRRNRLTLTKSESRDDVSFCLCPPRGQTYTRLVGRNSQSGRLLYPLPLPPTSSLTCRLSFFLYPDHQLYRTLVYSTRQIPGILDRRERNTDGFIIRTRQPGPACHVSGCSWLERPALVILNHFLGTKHCSPRSA